MFLFLSCDDSENVYEKRTRNIISRDEIVIGIVDSSLAPSLFFEGVKMAIDEINSDAGILGKTIRPDFYDDEGRPEKGEAIARKLVGNLDVLAVIGHRFSDVAIPVSVTYEENGLLFISPGATDQDLVRDGNQFTFRNIASDEDIGREAARFAYRNGYRKIVIIFDSESSGKRISEIFHEQIDSINKTSYQLSEKSFHTMSQEGVPQDIIGRIEALKGKIYETDDQFLYAVKDKIGSDHLLQFKELLVKSSILKRQTQAPRIEIVAEKAYAGWQRDFRPLIADIIKERDIDAIFIGGVLPSAAHMIKQLREMGINVPILGSELLDSSELWNIAGKTAEGTIVSTVFDPKQPKTPTRKFVKEFKARLGFEPDAWAAQGYDAVRLLAYAIETSGSFDPIVIGTTLRLLKNWEGVTGIYSFQDNGGISGKTIFFKEIKGGNFRFLERQLREEISLFEVIEDVTLRLPVEGVITTIDPGLCSDVTSIEIVEQLFMGLTDFDPETYEAVPELAKEWRVSEDGKTYRFLMRNDVTWTDGKPVTAHDVVWAVQRNIKPETNSPYAYVMSVIKNAAAINSGEIKDLSQIGVRAIDDFTVEFELEHPAAYFPGMAGLWVFRPLPRDIIAVHGDQWTHPEYIQTNGSYRLFAWEKGMVLILRKNPMYFNAEKVSIPEVRYYVIPESTVGMAMYRSNQLDIMGGTYLRLPIDQLPNIMSSPEFSGEFFQEPTLCTYSYGFNTRRPPMDNLLVRKAISAAIDRKLLVQLIARGNESATTFTRPPVFGAVDPKEKVGISFDPLQARAWLAEAGYPDGQGFPEIEVMYNQSETHEKIARAIQTFLKHYLNINLKLSPQEWEDYVRLRGNPETHHLYRFGWCADYPDANNWLNELFHPTKSPNYPGWNNQEFGELMELAERETDIEKRKQLYKRAEQILCEEECVMLPIYFEAGGFLVKPRIKGWYNMALGGQHIRNWYLEEQ